MTISYVWGAEEAISSSEIEQVITPEYDTELEIEQVITPVYWNNQIEQVITPKFDTTLEIEQVVTPSYLFFDPTTYAMLGLG